MSATRPAARERLRVRADRVELRADHAVIATFTGVRALLLCAVASFGPTSRARMAAWLWPDADAARARSNLRQVVRRVNLAGALLHGDPLTLPADLPVAFPWHDGEHAGPEGAGDPFELPDPGERTELAERFAAEAERRRGLHAERHAQAVEAALREGRTADALTSARRWLAADPHAVPAHLARMRAHHAEGDPHGLLDAYATLRNMMAHAFDAEPPDEARALARRAAATIARPAGGIGGYGAPGGTVVRRAEAGGWLAEAATLLRAEVEMEVRPVPRGRRLIDVAWLEHQRGRHDAAARAAREGLASLDGMPAASEGWFVLGSIALHDGRNDDAARDWRRAVAAIDASADPAGARTLRLDLAMVADALGQAKEARAHYLAAHALMVRDGDLRGQAIVLNNLAHQHLQQGNAGEACTLARAAIALARRGEDRQVEGHALDTLARATLAAGDAAPARSLAAQAFAVGREGGHVLLQVEALTTVAEAQRCTAGPEAARPLAREALRLARASGTLPGAFRAALAVARAIGRGHTDAEAMVAAVRDDDRAAAALRREAAALSAAWAVRRAARASAPAAGFEQQVDGWLAGDPEG
ncbi:MAG: BTAD domain-containing putative transcriptional regulator [Trueperaceae bacterium]|nr:BTAD domain-containing putative transcriptional regulator [Trueperaceae bacterium]